MRAGRLFAVGVVLLLGGCTAGAPPAATTSRPGTATATRAADGECAPHVQTGDLPEWARTGFTGRHYPPHVLSDGGNLIAILFGYPLYQPPSPDRGNKILWVSKAAVTPMSPLLIEAHLDGTSTTAHREVPGGPGPSIIDLPAAGCWRLDLSWSGYTDTMGLVYEKPS